MSKPESNTDVLTGDEQRKLRALPYALTPVDMLKVVIEVVERQKQNAGKNGAVSARAGKGRSN